jgi:hypothetical protein
VPFLVDPRLRSELHNYRKQNVYSQLLFNRKVSFLQKKVITPNESGQAVAQLVEALRYNSVGRGFD